MQRTFYRTVQKAQGRRLVIELPEEFENQQVEITALPTAEVAQAPIQDEATRLELLAELRKIWDKHRVDLSDYVFNRDELYDRSSLR